MAVLKFQRWMGVESTALDGGLVVVRHVEASSAWVVRYGRVPPAVDDLPGVAPVVAAGTLDALPVYAESIPLGLPLSRLGLPPELLRYVVHAGLLRLAGMHRRGLTHGAVSANAVWVGVDGSVTLIGRGRATGLASADVLSAWSMLGPGSEDTLPAAGALELAEVLQEEITLGRPQPLAAAVLAALADPALARFETVVLDISNQGTDEVVPDLGPDASSDGILDRWSTTRSLTGETTGHGEVTSAYGDDHTPPVEVPALTDAGTDGGTSPSPDIAPLHTDSAPSPAAAPRVTRTPVPATPTKNSSGWSGRSIEIPLAMAAGAVLMWVALWLFDR